MSKCAGEADRSLRFGEVLRRELGEALAKSESLPARLSASIGRIVANLPKISYELPHFVQEFASATWTHHEGKSVTKEDVAAITPGVQRMLDESIYDRQFAQLSPREVLFVLALQRLGPGAHRPDDIAESLGLSSSAELGSVRTQLIKKAIIYAPARGLAEFRLPLTYDYLERHKDEFLKRGARA